jgi:iron complex outermembrane receptor protein
MKNVRCLWMVLGMLVSLGASAQSVNGIILDPADKVIAGATVQLLLTKDSSVVKFTVTQADGSFVFRQVEKGMYLLSISHVNFITSFSSHFSVNENQNYSVPTIRLLASDRVLAGVTVSSKKPIIEVKADKTILNVEGTINATGTDALELLRKSPGVQVDRDDNLSMSGKNGVQVYIDGRPSPLSGKDLSDYLKSIPSAQIESIEMITNPSARYDAAGNAGIINIRLKKNKTFGTNGSINTGFAIGIYPKYNGGVSINHRNKQVNLFANYNTNIVKQEIGLSLDRTVLDTFFNNRNLLVLDPRFHSFKTGMDYFINKRNTIGIIVNGVVATGNLRSESITPIYYQPTHTLQKILKAGTYTAFDRNNINTNVNYRFADSLGRELNIDADYGYYKIRTNQLQPNIYYDATGTIETSRVSYRMIAPNDIYIKTLKTDYLIPMKNTQFSLGFKTAFVNSKNDFQRLDVFSTYEKKDTVRSNYFNYRENINAAYLNLSSSIQHVFFQMGLRVENTNTKGLSTGLKLNGPNTYIPYDSTFERHYTNLFPSAAITFKKNPLSQWSISYSRRIDRPTYQSLNPFEFRLDEYSFNRGNTNLRPQFTNSASITHIYKYKLTSKLNFSETKDIFTQFFDTTERSKVFITQRNLANQQIVSFDITYMVQAKWYSGYFNLNSYYSHYKADLGPGRVIDLDIYSTSFVMQNSVNVGKGLTLELTGTYSSPSLSQGTFRTRTVWGLDVGMQKLLLKNKMVLRMAVSDLFQTRWPFSESNFAGQKIESLTRLESRLFRINLSYRFGSNQVKAARQRKTGAEDELNRVQSN